MKTKLVTDNVTDIVVELITTTVSTDSKIEVTVLKVFYIFFDLEFLSSR